MNPNFWFHLIMLCLGTAAIHQSIKSSSSWPWSKTILTGLVIASAWGYSNFGRGHNNQETYHYSELWHYYLGSKYAKELSSYRIYDATASAFNELKLPLPKQVRDLKNPFHFMPSNDAIHRFQQEGKNHFTPEKWEEYKKDVAALSNASSRKTWPLHDAGYNPPPTYSLLVGSVSKLLPINTFTLNLMASFDWILLAIASILLWRTFGSLVSLAFLLVFFNNPLSNWFWIGGAYFRNIELLSLTAAICSMKTARWKLAGSAFGLAIAARGFPITFAAGAFIPLAYSYIKSPTWPNLKNPAQMAATLFLTLATLTTISLIVFTPNNWKDFSEKIENHSKILFTYHIGYEKIMANTWNKGPQYFDVQDSQNILTNFKEWHITNTNRFNAHWAFNCTLRLLLWGICIIACLREFSRTSTLLLGESTLFLFALPENYYYILLALFTANAVFDAKSKGGIFRLWIAFGIIIACNAADGISNDPIKINGIINWSIGLGLTAYTWSLFFKNHKEKINIRAASILTASSLLIIGILTFHPKSLPFPKPETPTILTTKDTQTEKGTASL